MRSIVPLLGAVLVASGCGLSHTIARDLLADISVENKLLLFDAENDVSIAIDERDRIQREIRDTKGDLRSVEDQLDDAASDAERAGAKGDDAGVELAYGAQEVFELKRGFLEARLDALRDRLRAHEGIVRVALARYELEKARLVKKNNVRGADEIELADFEDQVAEYVELAKADQEYLAELDKEVEALRQQWIARREQLQQASGGGVGSAWAEDGGVWGGN